MNLNNYLTPISPLSYFSFFAGMLKAVSLAVDLIMAHFNSRQDPEEKVVQGVNFFYTIFIHFFLSYNRNAKYYQWALTSLSDKIVESF